MLVKVKNDLWQRASTFSYGTQYRVNLTYYYESTANGLVEFYTFHHSSRRSICTLVRNFGIMSTLIGTNDKVISSKMFSL